jgi:transposase-like protein
MVRKVNRALRAQWRQRIERQRGSGLSIVEFCRAEGVSPACFHQWKRKLRVSPSAAPSPRQSSPVRRPTAARQVSTPQRQRLQTSPANAGVATGATSFLQLPVVGPRTSPWIELVLVDGTIVRVPQQNLAALQTVLQILRDGHAPTWVGEVSHA